MESSGSRSKSSKELSTSQEDLSMRPALQFIELVAQYLIQNQEEIKKINRLIRESKKQKEVQTSIKFFSAALVGLDEKFYEYEKNRVPYVDIEKINKVKEKEKIAANLEIQLKNILREHERKTFELRDGIDIFNHQIRQINGDKTVNESANMNDRSDNRSEVHLLERKKAAIKKKKNKICCACLPANKSKVQQYDMQLEEIQEEIINVKNNKNEEDQQLKEFRVTEAKRKDLFNKELDNHISEHKRHISVPFLEKKDLQKLAFERAEKSAQRARRDLEDAEWDALCEMSGSKISDLLFLMAHFLKLRQLVVELHLEQRKILSNTPIEKKESIDALVKAIHDFSDLLEVQQTHLEDAFKEFYCNNPKISGRAIYHRYQNLPEQDRNEFTLASSTNKDKLRDILELNTPVENPKVSHHSSTLHSKHRHKKIESMSIEGGSTLSSSTSSSSSLLMLTPHPNKE